MKKTARWLAIAALALIPSVSFGAGAVKPLTVTAADVQLAGYTKVVQLVPTADRWKGPTEYFSTGAFVAHDDIKKDCADCGSVVAAYAAVTDVVPGWSINQRSFIRKIGGRYQGRAYLADKKIVIVVTGGNQPILTKLFNNLKTKFGG